MAAESVMEVAHKASALSGKPRLQLWKSTFSRPSRNAEFLETNAAELVGIVFSTLPVYRDAASRQAVVGFLREAIAASDVFLKAFAAALIKCDPAKRSNQECIVLLSWNDLLLRQLRLPAAAKAAARVVASQAGLLDSLVDHPRWPNIVTAAGGVLRDKPALLNDYVAVARSGSPGAMRLVLRQLASQPEQLAAQRPALLAAFVEHVVNARTQQSAAVLAAYSQLLAAATHEEMSGVLLPAALRMMKRSPDVALPTVAAVCRGVRLDLSADAALLAEPLGQLCRHPKELVRSAAADTFAALASRVSDAQIVSVTVVSLLDVLDGKAVGGKPKSAPERSGVLAGVQALAAAPGSGAGIAQAAESTVLRLLSVYKAEANEEVKLSMVAALGAWLPRVQQLQEAVLAHFQGGLKDKEALRRAHLRCLVQVLQAAPDLAKEAAPLAAAVTPILAEAVAKAAVRSEGIAALLIVATLAAQDAAAADHCSKQKVWQSAAGSGSPLLTPAALARLSDADTALLPPLAEVLLMQHGQRLDAAATAAVCRALVVTGLHHHRPARRAAVTTIARCVAQAPSVAGLVLDAARHWLRQPFEGPVYVDTADDSGISRAIVAHRFRLLLLALTPRSGDGAGAQLVVHLALAACHPVVSPTERSSRARPLWVHIRRRLPDAPARLAADPEAVVATLLGDQGAGSAVATERRAGLAALRTCMADAAEALWPPLQTRLQTQLQRADHDALSQADIAKWAAPEGMLAAEVGAQNGFVAEVVQDKNVRKPRGRFKTDYDDDDQPSSKPSAANGTAGVRPSQKPAGKPSAGKAGAKKDPAAERRARLLAEEAEVRAHVNGIKARLEAGLAALAATASGDAAFTAEHLEEMAPLAAPLLASPLVGEGAAWDAARAMAAGLPRGLSSAATALATAHRLVALQAATGYPTHKDLAAHPAVKSSVAALAAATAEGQPLPGPVWAFVFPIVQALLNSRVHTPLHEAALGTIVPHVAPGAPLPRAETLALLYHLLGVVPTYRERVQPLLDSLCAGVDTPELPAALGGLVAASAHVRSAALAALPSVPLLAAGECPADAGVAAILWLARFDASVANAEEAQNLWEDAGAELPDDYAAALTPYLGHQHEDVRSAAADGLAAAVEEHPDSAGAALDNLTAHYADAGIRARNGAAQALRALAPLLGETQVQPALDFLLASGLGDPDADVRELMVTAGVALVDAHGPQHSAPMLAVFERYLDGSVAAGTDEDTYDRVREGVVVLLGTLARHLPPSDPKVRTVVETLLEVLTTPSEAVQRAVSGCLPPLMGGLAADTEYIASLVQRLLAMLSSDRYGDRRGGAYGIAGVVKGLGIVSLRGQGIMDALKAGIDNKGNPKAREGALFAFECLVERLGRLFEPYVIQILPMLLVAFGDGDPGVREATDGASRAIMSQLSGQGVKLVLPALLKGVEDKAWRTKQGSIQLLGAMAYCAPKQLSQALPTIVPRLSSVLTDPHPRVQSAARAALVEVGSVIRNPEVSVLVPTLLAAIADPGKHTRNTLEVLLDTVFINTIDAASLALIVPVVARGLRDRSGDAKRKAARIVGNMCALINEPKDMAPYVGLLMPELQAAVVDPLPEVRATAARALGSLLRGMGAEHFSDLVPWLLTTLRSEGSGVERSGAAQGLAEVLGVLGPEYLAGLLPDILATCGAKSAFAREGSLTLFKFLPLVAPDECQAHLEEILPAVLGGLADEAEGVRTAALAAGRTLVDLYTLTALELLLPAILDGTGHANWRIRQSSIELLGDLLYKVAGVTGKVQVDGGDDEGISTEAQGAAILAAFGVARRNEVLARVFMARSDTAYSVRTAAVHVWKTVVVNTPRTTTEILPVLMTHLIEALGSPVEERREMSATCIGELVRKMGERVLHKILPILQEGMQSEDTATRQGVCYGIQEVLKSVTRQQLSDMLPAVLPVIQTALCDDDASVRTAAGGAFGILFKGGGGAVDQVIPSLLASLSGDEAGQALAGLRVILSVRPSALATMLPRLLKPPLSAADIIALGSLAEVAGPAVHNHLSSVLPPLLELASRPPEAGSAKADAAREALAKVVGTVAEEGAYLLVGELVKALEEPARRRGAADAIALFCRTAKFDFQEHLSSFITALVPLFTETNEGVLLAVWTATGAATAAVPKELGPAYVRTLKEAVGTAVERQRRRRLQGPLLLPGLCLPKALAPLLPIYLQGVLQGSSAELRELAAEGLGELVGATGEDALRPFVVQITGPLIRIIGDRFASGVKAAILGTMSALLGKAGPALKPFLPQLQTTFLKCLADPAKQVRAQAAINVGQLAALSPRVDALAGDQLASALHTAEPGLKEGYAAALRGLLNNAGARLSAPVISKLGGMLMATLPTAGEDEALISELAGCLGAWAEHADASELSAALAAGPLSGAPAGGWPQRLGAVLTLASTIQHALPRVEELGLAPQAEAAIVRFARDDTVAVKVAAAAAAAGLIAGQLADSGASAQLPGLVPALVGLLGPDQASEVQRAGLQVLRRVAAVDAAALGPHLSEVVPLVTALASGGAGPTRLAAERALTAALRLNVDVAIAQEWLATGKPGPTARNYLTEPTLRRLARLPLDDTLDDGVL